MPSPKSEMLDIEKVKPVRHKNGALSIHPYFGKVDPALAQAIIKNYSLEGQYVLDPFCGSGTVLHESVLLKRSVIGWDSSKLAVLLSTAKLIGNDNISNQQLDDIKAELHPYGSKSGMFKKELPLERQIPAMPRLRNVDMWFGNNALQELGFVNAYINKTASKLTPTAKILCLTAFSRIIISASNQEGESSYRKIDKPDFSGRVIDLFVESLTQVQSASFAFNELVWNGEKQVSVSDNVNIINWGEISANLIFQDAREAQHLSTAHPLADLVVTSPPYLMSWDYGLYHKLRFYWLGFDLDMYEETEIGRHLRRKNDDVVRYEDDMKKVFVSLSANLKKKATIAIVNAPSVVHGKTVDTNQILVECAKLSGWKLDNMFLSVDIPGPHHGMYASLESRKTSTAGKSGKREHVLIFTREF